MDASILVVDDQLVNQRLMQTTLAREGVAIVCATSGEEALRCLAERPFALILLDVDLPDVDGFATAALIRARPEWAQIPIIFVTASDGDTTHVLKAYETGAADCVTRPVDPVVLRSKAAVFVDLFRAAAAGRRAAQLEDSNRHLEADLAASRKLSESLAYQASHDELTGLPNRHLFEEILTESIALSRRTARPLAVAFLDLDRFKFVNDTFGHDAGDDVLKETARRLSATVRSSDVVARLAGDEFVVLLTEFSHWLESALVIEKLLRAFTEPFNVAGNEVMLQASIGIAVFPEDGDNAMTLLKRADVAMYQTKHSGGGGYRFCTPRMSASAARRHTLDSELRTALTEGQYLLHYQPKGELRSGRILGVEALLRWQRPQRGLVSAAEFIHVAEETGLVVQLGEWALGEACRQARAWSDGGLPLNISVNLSQRQLRGDRLLRVFSEAVDAAGIPPSLIEFEITEHAAIFDNAESLAILRRLRELGCRIALDDFGSGYSSLAWLRRFPFDALKLNLALVSGLPGDKQDVAVAKAVMGVARGMDIRVVAQGVCNEEQLRFLEQQGCDQIQGEWLSMPIAADRCEAFVRARLAALDASAG